MIKSKNYQMELKKYKRKLKMWKKMLRRIANIMNNKLLN
jgi:hypothetical protein